MEPVSEVGINVILKNGVELITMSEDSLEEIGHLLNQLAPRGGWVEIGDIVAHTGAISAIQPIYDDPKEGQ